MTGSPAIRSELHPRAREAIAAARADLATPAALVDAIDRWIADEERLDGHGRKARSTDAAVIERRAIVAEVAERTAGPLTSRESPTGCSASGCPRTRPPSAASRRTSSPSATPA